MEYNLTFLEAMDYLKREGGIGLVQGEYFSSGIVLKEGLICIQCYDFYGDNSRDMTLTHNLVNQHYKVVQTKEESIHAN